MSGTLRLKKCRECGELKDMEFFYPKFSDCKICTSAIRKTKYVKDIVVARVKKWREANREKLQAARKRYRIKYREKRNAAGLARYYAKKDHCLSVKAKWRAENKVMCSDYNKKWAEENKFLINEKAARRRAAQRNAVPSWFNKEIVNEFYKEAQKKSLEMGTEWHVDHIVPLQSKLVCGLHVQNNLQVISGSDNCKKSNSKWPDMPERL